VTRKAEKAVTAMWDDTFTRQAKATAKKIRGTLFKDTTDEDRQTHEEFAASLDYGLTASEVQDVAEQFASVAGDSGGLAFAQISVDAGDDAFEQLNDRALAWAKEHAADLVTKISKTTRAAVQRAIEAGTEANLSTDEIADSIEGLGVFSAARSQLIAHTEIANANSQGALEGYKAAADTGITVLKEWLLGGDPCPICQDNADAGPIPLDDQFPSGDDAPTAHPKCECALSPVLREP
jgi:hypothetical protein